MGELSKELQDQIARSVEAFQSRPIYKELSEEIIDAIPDEELLQAVFDNLSEQLSDDFEDEYGIVMSWNKSRQAIYTIWLLESEVNNGGYNQFYSNSSGQFYKLLPEALRLVGARQFADVTQRANTVFEKYNDDIIKEQDGSVEGFAKSYEDNPLNDLDIKFYELYTIEDLNQAQVRYVRTNKRDFIQGD